MNTEQFEIVGLFSKGLNIELTINQVSKIIKKSYAYTNKHMHDLIEVGILNRKDVGSAILCSLNFREEKTIAALVYNSMMKSPSINKEFRSDIVVRSRGRYVQISDKSNLEELDLSDLIIVKGHELFWRRMAEMAR